MFLSIFEKNKYKLIQHTSIQVFGEQENCSVEEKEEIQLQQFSRIFDYRAFGLDKNDIYKSYVQMLKVEFHGYSQDKEINNPITRKQLQESIYQTQKQYDYIVDCIKHSKEVNLPLFFVAKWLFPKTQHEFDVYSLNKKSEKVADTVMDITRNGKPILGSEQFLKDVEEILNKDFKHRFFYKKYKL